MTNIAEKATTLEAEIISIGDEITSGSIVDTNSAWLSEELNDLGIRTLYHTTVGDELEPMIDVFRTAAKRAQVILITGGLGPTEDDLTRQMIAQALNRHLIEDPKSLHEIEEMFRKRGRTMPESNRKQAFFPKGSQIITNPNGTAPGFVIEEKQFSPKTVLILTFPGVPAEMKEMWRLSGRTRVHSFAQQILDREHVVLSRKIHCFGEGESVIEARLPHLIARTHTPIVGITAKEAVITLRIRAEAGSFAEAEDQIRDTRRLIYKELGRLIFGEDEDTLPLVVCSSLRTRGKKIAVLEWGTRGLLASKIEPDCFCGGRIVPSDISFTKEALASAFTSLKREGSPDYILAIGPYPKKTEPLENQRVFVGLLNVQTNELHERLLPFGAHPAILDTLFCFRALDMLRLQLT